MVGCSSNMAEQGKISSCHMGTPCGSGTMARDVQLRSWEEPYGVTGLGTYHAEIVRVGNRLIEFSVKFCTALWKGGSYFSIENPWPCWTWVHPWMVALWNLTGVIFTTFVMQRFKAPYEKLSGLLHNYPFGWMLGRMRDHSAAVTPLRGKVKVGDEWVFRTRLAEVYPMDFGTQYEQMAAKSLEYRKRCIQQHVPVQMADASMDGFPHHFDWSQLEEVWLQGRCDDGSGATFVPYGNGAVAGFTKQEHMAWGKAQPHPLDTPLIQDIEPDLAECMKFEVTHDIEEINEFRQQKPTNCCGTCLLSSMKGSNASTRQISRFSKASWDCMAR